MLEVAEPTHLTVVLVGRAPKGRPDPKRAE